MKDQIMSKVIFTQVIQVKYNQAGAAPGEPYDRVYYTVEMKATSYMQAVEFLNNIAASCNGVITFTQILPIKQEQTI